MYTTLGDIMDDVKKLHLKPKTPPILSNWIIKYDDIFNMPQYIQGKLVTSYKDMKAKDNVILDNLLGVDLGKVKKAYTTDGETFLLLGEGRRIFLVDNVEPEVNWLLDDFED